MDEPRSRVSAAAYWEGLYAQRQDGWELGEATLGPFFRIVEAGPPPALPERRRGLEWLARVERRAG